MKFISVLAVVMTWLATACASEPNTAKDKVVYSSPTAEETAQFDEWLLNGQGKLDAISAKYNVSRDTMLKIMMGYSGMDSIKPTIVFPDLLTRACYALTAVLRIAEKRRRRKEAHDGTFSTSEHLQYGVEATPPTEKTALTRWKVHNTL